MLTQTITTALANLVILAGVPFGIYFAYHKLRHKRTFGEITARAGLRLGETRYLWYCVALAAVSVAVLALAPFSVEPFTREDSPQQRFVGLGWSGPAITMALVYGMVATGFCEELLFRGLIAGCLGRRMKLAWANLLQATIFFLPHLLVLLIMPEHWTLLPIVFVIALFLGWVRIKSGSIVGPWLVHGVGNVAMCLVVAVRSAG